ncbi:hypothetical protein DSL72_001719 [Monilinia vaccinii-corymbosi]|uniref:Uncharacterized protein n=1 Tax=Monilinia vaccinii-corymbosi TaxID=61207 RepID=A0A8A3PA98_9HELO|nr:hypothetical protein DSL72_001719 [Monilinia vaccinii-corymbosi]
MSMGPPPIKTDQSSDDDFLRNIWARHLNTEYPDLEAQTKEEDNVVKRILERAGTDGRIMTKREICAAYRLLRKSTDPLHSKPTPGQLKVVEIVREYLQEPCNAFPAWDPVDKDTVNAEKQLINEIVENRKLGEEYKDIALIGRDYILYKDPDDIDCIVEIMEDHYQIPFKSEGENYVDYEMLLLSIKRYFGNIKDEDDATYWYVTHGGKPIPMSYYRGLPRP